MVCQIDGMLSKNEANLVSRVLDANYNRAVEGLRAVEEYFRFIRSHETLTTALKSFRHRLREACADHTDSWASHRQQTEDVGTTISTPDEYSRSTVHAIVGANLARVSQALRVLEEYAKTSSDLLARKIEAIRYDFYELEKSIKRDLAGTVSLNDRTIYVLTSGCSSLPVFEDRIHNLCRAGADLIQLREKNLPDGELLQRAKRASLICRDHNVLLIVNDRPDIAVMAEAHGVHVGQDELPVDEIRKLFAADMLIGLSTHSIEQATEATTKPVDYIGVGPTFPSHTKCFSEFKGPELLKQVSQQVPLPAFAIGGINLDNIDQVAESGITRIAVSQAVHSADDPAHVIHELRQKLNSSSRTPCP